jgi:succinyl-diaminopimelate desuccinylase
MGEETGNVGMKHLISRLPHLDAAIVAEWTGASDVAIGYRGALWLELKTTGRAAHGARPREGINAIDLMTEQVLPAIKRLPWSYEANPIFQIPDPTINIGRIEGGDRANVVADSCRALIDFRLVPGITCEDTLSLVHHSLETVQRGWNGATVSCRPLLQNEPFLLGESETLLKVLSHSVEDVTGNRPRRIGKTGFSDANVLVGKAGIPAVTYGPGNNSGHGPDEFIELEQVVTAARAIALTALRFTRGDT